MRTVTSFISLLLVATLTLPAAGQRRGGERSFRLEGVALRASLDSLRAWFPVPIVFLDRDVEGKSSTAACDRCGLEESLGRVLEGTGLTWIRMDGQVIIRRTVPDEAVPLASVSGTVADSLTGEPVAGANVLLYGAADDQPIRWCSTNSFGFYSLRNIPPGPYALRVRSMGYRSTGDSVTVQHADTIDRNALLVQESIPMQEVTVEGRRADLRPAAGLTRGVYIRSAPVDQTEYLLDGARIYNPTHIGGILSVFNPEAMNDVEIHQGGIPPYYGGRLGGILDLSLRNGRSDRTSGVAGIGTLGAHGAVEGPLGPKTTGLLSVRRSYPGLFVPGLQERDTPNRLGSTELVGRVTHAPSGRERFLLSGYLGADRYTNEVSSGGKSLRNAFEWKNTLLNLKWVEMGPSLFLQGSAAYTRYDLSLVDDLTGFEPSGGFVQALSGYVVEDFSLRGHAEHFYDEHHTVQGGVELIRHRISGSIDQFATRLAPYTVDEPAAWELSVYLQDQWRLVPSVTAELGARATTFSSGHGAFSSVDPRFSLLVEPGGNARLFGSVSAVNQYLHPYRSSGIFALYPTLFWYPSGEGLAPTTAIHVTAGAILRPEDGGYEGILELFHRTAQGVHEPDTLQGGATGLADLLRSGSGRSFGFQCIVRKRIGPVTGSASYSWSKSELTFPGLNGGKSFSPRFDRRHELQGSIQYVPDDHWSFGAQVAVVPGMDTGEESESWLTSKSDAALAARAPWMEAEGNRLPGFQRLEFSIGYRMRIGPTSGTLTFRLLNGYGLLDPILWELVPSDAASQSWRARLRPLELFPLFPVADFTLQL